jgi:hypothetical protein
MLRKTSLPDTLRYSLTFAHPNPPFRTTSKQPRKIGGFCSAADILSTNCRPSPESLGTVEDGREEPGCSLLLPREHVRVRVQRGFTLAVPETFLHDL